MIHLLYIDIIQIINNYLSNRTKLNLKNSNKLIYGIIKPSTIYSLDKYYSLKYMYSKNFYQYVNKRIGSQIDLNLSGYDKYSTEFFTNLSYKFISCCIINNISTNNLIKLNLMGTNISNLNIDHLINIKNLDLSYTKIQNVSKLANVYDLNLNTTYVNDVTGLKCHKLNLNYTKVTDVNCLIYTKILYICHTNVNDVSKLNQLEVLDASLTNIANVEMLINLKSLNVSCTEINSIKQFKNMKNLEVLNINFTDFIDFIELSELKKLKHISSYNLFGNGLNKYIRLDEYFV